MSVCRKPKYQRSNHLNLACALKIYTVRVNFFNGKEHNKASKEH